MDPEKLNDMLKEAREVIDGECNCNTPEYRALDLLERSIRRLYDMFTVHVSD